MKRRALSLLAACAIASAAIAAARAEGRASYGGGAEGALATAPVTFGPLSRALGDEELSALLYDTLFQLDAAGRPRPHLALGLDETPPVPGVPLVAHRARIHLRTDVRFSDGTPLTARDVAASLTRALTQPGGWTLGPIRAARAIGDDTVELELTRAAPDLALLLSTPAASVLAGAAPGARPKGSGPFVLTSVTPGADGVTVRLAANPLTFAGRPYLDTLTLSALSARAEATRFETGALALARHAAPGLVGVTRPAATLEAPPTQTVYLAFGRGLPDDEARALHAAFDLGIDRARLVQKVRGPARAALSAAPPALGGLERPLAHDPQAARAQLAARFPSGLSLTLLYDRDRSTDRALAGRLLVELAHLGVTLTLDEVAATRFAARAAAGDYQLLLDTSAPPAPSGGLAELALLAAVDPEGARARLARAPAEVGAIDFASTRVLPLLHRGVRLSRAPALRGVTVDAAGRVDWAEVHWRR